MPRHACSLALAVLALSCAGAPPDDEDPGEEGTTDVDTPPPPLPDDLGETGAPPIDDGWVPRKPAATRFGIFYQLSRDVLDLYQSDRGLPQVSNHAWIITQSHATAFASRPMADMVHRRADFYYAPAFDLWDDSHNGWQIASDATLRTWAHEFRDTAIRAHADLFTFNEAPTTTGSSDNVRVQIAKILRFLHEPDPQGRQLWGVMYFTQKPSMAANWTSPANAFFQTIDDTCIALVAEFYHSTGYTCLNTIDALANHYFSLRKWLVASGEPAKLSIANTKFTVLHSSRFADGTSGWAGGDATQTTLATFQRALSRNAEVTRTTDGGLNRLAFGPTTTAITQFGVQPRITALYRWHYLHTTPQASELPCIDNFAGNCTCD
ncbi:MAG TPA: hypothetical protein VFQ53_43155 [Kofleriaceae bacterium]|nr:hypothetical protein [Kofleriaceae bacterium]